MGTKSSDLYFKLKEKFVLKGFDTGFSNYQRLEGKIGNVRQWTVTINIGFTVYVLSENKNRIMLFIAITVFMLILLLLELRVRRSMALEVTLNKKSVWFSQKAIVQLFRENIPAISTKHKRTN